MKEADNLIKTLTPLERKVLPLLKNNHKLSSLKNSADISETEINRALQWLENKKIISTEKNEKEIIELEENGKKYILANLPERRFLNSLQKPMKLNDIKNTASLNDDELRVCIGLLKKKNAITIGKKVSLTENGRKILKEIFPEENLLKKLPIELINLTDEERLVFFELKKRKNIISINNEKEIKINLTNIGKELLKKNIKNDFLEILTKEMLVNRTWKNKEFRHYNIKSITPKVYGGRIHPLSMVIKDIKKIFLNMGFKEMKSSWVDTAFWCMDSMWIPQDHPSREVQDTFFLPYKGSIPSNLAKKVAAVHEHGNKTGSKGHGYKWNPEIAKQLILRTHTTATTYRYFHNKKITYPAKYFCVGRIFRNESIDSTHLPEFHQVEGFVMDEGLTLRDLMGYIKEFYSKMGIDKIKFKPTYNPYTEPSMEALGYNEELGKWIELINSGIFRPESLEPYGIKVPVIAWGLGVERLAMMIHKKSDIREIFGSSSDLNWLREYSIKW